MPITAKIVSISRSGDGVSVSVEFSDGSNQPFEFNPMPSGADIRAVVKAEVNRRNQIDTQVNRLQTLVGVEID
jgi:hypothetical protein